MNCKPKIPIRLLFLLFNLHNFIDEFKFFFPSGQKL